MDTWLAAQNSGDFAAYEALYAGKMTGIRRSGKQVVRLDRAGWMGERKRMFKKPMTVAAERFSFVPREAGLHIYFTQTWASGKYKDVGRKVLVLGRDGGALKIRFEEMLESKILPPSKTDEDTELAGPRPEGGRARLSAGLGFGSKQAAKLSLAFVSQGEAYVARLDRDIGTGEVQVVEVSTEAATGYAAAAVLKREADDKALPPELAAARGMKVQVYDAGLSPLCLATIGKTFTLVAADWSPGETYQEDVVREIWTQGKYIAVAALEGDAECVKKAAFVRDAALPALSLPPPLSEQAELVLLHGEEAEKPAAENEGEADGEEQEEGKVEPDITRSAIAVPGGRAAVAVQTHVPDTCDTQESYELVIGIQSVDGAGEWSTDLVFMTEQEETLLFATDVDGDGVIELVTDRGVYMDKAEESAGEDKTKEKAATPPGSVYTDLTKNPNYDVWLPDLRVYWPPGLTCDEYDSGRDEPPPPFGE